MKKVLQQDAAKVLVAATIGLLIIALTALANRNIYSKEEIDLRFEYRDERLDRMADQIEWLYREAGGPSES